MKRIVFAVCGLLAIAGSASMMGGVVGRDLADAGPVYPVATVDAGLSHRPGAWVDRTIRVQGVVYGTWCDVTAPCERLRGSPMSLFTVAGGDRFVLVSAQHPPPHGYDVQQPSLLLALGPAEPIVATMRRLPLLAGLSPAPQRFAWGVPAVLRVHLQPRSCPFPTRRWCYEGVVLDGAMP